MAARFRTLLIAMFTAGIGLALSPMAWADIAITDAAGREVRLSAPAKRIVTNESLLLLSLGLIDPDPVSKIAGWAAARRIDKGIYASFRQRFPAMDDIPEVGAVVPANASAEPILALQPDLFVVSIWQPGWENVAGQLAAAGVPVLFLDGPENDRHNPAEAVAFSLMLLGKAIGQEEKAAEYGAFVAAKYRSIEQRLAGTARRPNVLIDVHAGTLCCYTPGSGNRITQYLQAAGGRNIGADVASGYDGQLNAEYVLGVDPDVYVGTGSPHLGSQGGLVVGGGIDVATARASLRDVTSRNFLGELKAVREGRAFAVSHQLAISALNVLIFECFAKWTHPDLFADLDPSETLDEINRRFMAAPLEGTFWVELNEASGQTAP